MGVSRVSAMAAMVVVVLMFVSIRHNSDAFPWPSPSPHGTDLSLVLFSVLPSIIGEYVGLVLLVVEEVEGGKVRRSDNYYVSPWLNVPQVML